jgi:hypothetical protein
MKKEETKKLSTYNKVPKFSLKKKGNEAIQIEKYEKFIFI